MRATSAWPAGWRGLNVLMYMGQRLVKSTLGPSPGPIPTSGPVSYRGKNYRAYTFTRKAFPSGPLRITRADPVALPLSARAAQAATSEERFCSSDASSSSKASANFSTPSRSSVSVTSA